MRAKFVKDTVEWEPRERWAGFKGLADEASMLTEEQIARANSQIGEYLDKHRDKVENSVCKPRIKDVAEQLNAEELLRLRSVDMSADVQQWELSAATDFDRTVLRLLHQHRDRQSHDAKKLRNLLILSLRTQHGMPVEAIAEKVRLSKAAVWGILRSLNSVSS